MIPVQLIIAGTIAIASFGAAWTYQGSRYEAKLSQYQLEYTIALEQATTAALEKTNALQKAKDEAEQKAQRRITTIRRELNSVNTAFIGLSNATDQALRSANTTHSACINDANNIAIVFGQCTNELRDMAEAADGWHNESQTLREAWPH